jgi:hypothetical protein
MIGIILALGSAPLFSQKKGPAIVFENESRDFGKVSEGDDIKNIFKFTNKGDALLEIFEVRPG